MANHGLVPRRLLPDDRFNWVYVVDLVVALILTVFFLFYFNRVFGRILAYGLRTYTWHKYRIYIDVEALQVSPLAGRIFFKGFRYHGNNETILINDGYLTWRYWLRRVRQPEYFLSHGSNGGPGRGTHTGSELGEKGGQQITNKLPCRIKAKVRGIEWYIYNRNPAYDAILENLSRPQQPCKNADEVPLRKRAKLNKSNEAAKQRQHDHMGSPSESSRSSSDKHMSTGKTKPGQEFDVASTVTTQSSQPQATPVTELPLLLQILPIKLECSKGAIVMGNENTSSIMTARFDSVVGRIDAQKPCLSLDKFKQLIDLDFQHPVIHLRPNQAYTSNQHIEATKESNVTQAAQADSRLGCSTRTQHQRQGFWSTVRDKLPYLGGSDTSLSRRRMKYTPGFDNNAALPGKHRWLGLTRYMDEEDDLAEQERWKAVEYGRFETIVDSPGIAVKIHWDVPGQVPSNPAAIEDLGSDVNNKGISPDWGIDLRVRGGEVHYGPWADRQRTDLQNVFFPTLYKDALPAPSILPGEPRVSTIFKLVIDIEESTKIILHTREESKDWRWKGHAAAEHGFPMKSSERKSRGKKKGEKANLGPEIRPYGWLDLQVSPDSTINFTMDLAARPDGYHNRLELDLRAPEMASSVNHELLWRSKSQLISCDLSNPLEWNSLRHWGINVMSDAMEIFLLRDHIFLLTDLINDWSSGPTNDYYTFVPFKYSLNLHLNDFRLYLNANDSNIINNPSDIDDNTFIVIWGEHLDVNVRIPLEHFQPSRNAISFEVDARDGGFELRTPQWNTQHTFLKDSGVASLNGLRIKAAYDYATSTSPALTDTLTMQVYGESPKINLYGFLIRYLMKVKDNYFGEDLHFRTLEEYKDQVAANKGHRETDIAQQHIKVSNDLDVILNITADNSCAILPSGLYTAADGISLDIASIRGDLRFTNYYMDLAIIFSPISLAHVQSTDSQDLPDAESSTQIFLKGLNVYGHRLFGLPPTEPTYVCNWDFDVGSITGECNPPFLHGLLLGIRCFAFSFNDAENALPPLNPPVIHDVTFLRIRVQPVLIWLCTRSAAFQLGMQSVRFIFNDWAGTEFSEKISLQIRDLTVAIVDVPDALSKEMKDPAYRTTQAYLQTHIDIGRMMRKSDFKGNRHLQQDHVNMHDARTHRTPWLLNGDDPGGFYPPTSRRGKIRQPAMQFPHMPWPTKYAQGLSMTSSSTTSLLSRSESSSKVPKTASRQSSFITDKLRRDKSTASVALRNLSDFDRPLPQMAQRSPTVLAAPNNPHLEQKRGVAQMGITSPSPYRTPHFSMQDLDVDLRDVPVIAEDARPTLLQRHARDDPSGTQPPDQTSARSSTIIELSPMSRVFCTPKALDHTMDLLSHMEMDSVNRIFDDLHLATIDEVCKLTDVDQEHPADILEFNIRIPKLRVKVLSLANHHTQSIPKRSGLCVDMEHLVVTGRMTQEKSKDQPRKSDNESLLHASLQQICLSIIPSSGGIHLVQPTMRCTVSDIALWSCLGDRNSAATTFKDTAIVITGEQLGEVLPSTFQTINVIQATFQKFSQSLATRKVKRSHLVLAVVLAGENIPDPPFLTRASYVLRSANNHLRASDSWKLMARLRHIMDSLPPKSQAYISDRSMAHHTASPSDARERLAASLEHWRAWDRSQVKQSLLIQKVYGPERIQSIETAELATPLKSSLKGGTLRVECVIGHGHNQIITERIEIAILHNQPAATQGGFIDPETFSVGDTVLQAHCTNFTINLDMDLCKLATTILDNSLLHSLSEPQQTPPLNAPLKKRKIQLVMSLDTILINLVTWNLRGTLFCHAFKASTLVSNSTSRQTASFVVSADTTASELQSHSRILTVSKLRQPSIFGSTDTGINAAKMDGGWRIAASSDSVSLKLMEDPLLIIEVLDIVLKDEATYIRRFAQDIKKYIIQSHEATKIQNQPTSRKAHVTLCLNSYAVSLMILPSLIYEISGGVSRTTVQHGLRQASETLIDLDISDHIHAFKGFNQGKSEHIAAVQIPPFNGRLNLDFSPVQSSVKLNAGVEEIRLDASTFHALLIMVSRQEISLLARSVKRESQILHTHFDELFGPVNHPAEEVPTGNPLLYDVYINADGLTIRASSPLSTTTAREGQLEFNFGSAQAKATNSGVEGKSALHYPEIELYLNSIQASLKRIEHNQSIPSGQIAIAASLKCTSRSSPDGEIIPDYQIRSSKFGIDMYAETAPTIIDIIGHLQDTIKKIDLTTELRTLRSVRRSRMHSELGSVTSEVIGSGPSGDNVSTALFGAMYSLEMVNIRLSWILGSSIPMSPGREAEDMVLSLSKIDLSTKRDNAARLLIEDLQLQMVPASQTITGRSSNSALLPQVIFNVAYLSTVKDRRLAFQAAGKSLDLRLTSNFILPASDLRKSIAFAIQEVRTATADWKASAESKENQTRELFGGKKFASILVDADFAGAIVYIEGRNSSDRQTMASNTLHGMTPLQYDRSNRLSPDHAGGSTTLRSPGLAFKVEYKNAGADQQSLNAEIKVDASDNVLHPTVVPLILDISSSVKEAVEESQTPNQSPEVKQAPPSRLDDNVLRSADPDVIFGKCKVNFGLRICKQVFSLSCQPIARVAATARFEDIYVTINTIQSRDHGQFFTISAVFTKLQASVQHAYSRESTGNLNVDSVFLSLVSSKHVSAANGLCVIIKFSPLELQVNARQLQDVLLFRDIWYPQEVRPSQGVSGFSPTTEPQAFVVQRYQQVAAADAFPWNATVSIAQVDVQLDLGQSIGRSAIIVDKFWVSSKKTSNWEQNLCLGFDRIKIDASGRMSGLIELQKFRVRTLIQWPTEDAKYQTPLVQASVSFDHLRVKAAFDYQPFAVLNITTIDFLMYNVRPANRPNGDRLVAIVEGDKVQVFCTAVSASQGLALYQAIQRLIQEKQTAYEASLKDVERALRRTSFITPFQSHATADDSPLSNQDSNIKVPNRLQTNVMVQLHAVNTGVYPSTFFDHQILKLEAKDASAKFTVALEQSKVHSTLGMTLGQLRVALSGVARPGTPKKMGEVAIDEVIASATASRGGLILGVPRTVVNMQIWQVPESNHIDHIFRSSFEGNIDVGWNYSRISFIRGMHSSHVRALAQRLGKPLPQSAVQITGGRGEDGDGGRISGDEKEKITAVVNVPLSRYNYTALQPALIDTPQLRNLGEATPPLEWIGLHRERLPNITHQIVIVSLLEVAKEVEDAYTKILGSS